MAASEEDPPPNATVYVKNINERIKIPELVDGIKEAFGEVGTIVEVIAKKNIKARGQAFIVYESVDEAEAAIDVLQGFELFGKPMELAFAKTRSDVTVLKEDGDEGLEQHKRHRLAEKERKQALEAATLQQNNAKRAAADALAERPAKTARAGASTNAGLVPDEYLPPNKILVLRDLPESYGQDNISAIFRRYPGFKELRMVPGRKGLGFVEYEDENAAITAKEATAGMVLGEAVIKVTYQRQ